MKSWKLAIGAGAASLLFGLVLMAPQADAAGIAGSSHDFSTGAWVNADGEICKPCHTPHNAATQPPLWAHNVNMTQGYTMYAGLDLQGVGTAPGTVSRLCLSCHDGVFNVGDFVNSANTGTTIATRANFGTDLSNDHPVGITYNQSADAELNAPGTLTNVELFTAAGAVSNVEDSLVECASCHDAHNTGTAAGTKLLKASMAASALCLECHAK